MDLQTTDLVKIDVQNAVQIFTGGGLDSLIDGVESRVRELKLDASTESGRDQIRTVAHQIARTKTALDAEGKALTEGWRKNTALVNTERKRAWERLEKLQEEVRRPLTEFETKEARRVQEHEAAFAQLANIKLALQDAQTVDHLEDLLTLATSAHVDRVWEEFAERVAGYRTALVAEITSKLEARKKYEADQAELARLRQAEAERQQRERDERLKAEAAEKARIEAEHRAKAEADAEAKRVIEAANAERARVAAEAARVQAENERVMRESRDRHAAETRAREEAEQRARDAEAARVAAEAKAAADLKAAREKAKRDQEAAVQRARDKQAREAKAAEEERAKREADQANRARVHAGIVEDLEGLLLPAGDADKIATMLMNGEIRNVQVIF